MPISGGSGGSPGGAAGGDLTGTYPNPTVAATKITAAKMSSGAAALNAVATADGAGAVNYTAVASLSSGGVTFDEQGGAWHTTAAVSFLGGGSLVVNADNGGLYASAGSVLLEAGSGGGVAQLVDDTGNKGVSVKDNGASPIKLGFYGAAEVTRPNIPAVFTPQQVVDALVSLGLVTNV